MADLISRAAAIDVFMGKPPDFYHTSYIVGEINCLPSVDAVPVVHARWKSYCVPHWTKRFDDYGDPEYKYHDEHVCSACGRRTVIKENFCPKCGAKMDGGQEARA